MLLLAASLTGCFSRDCDFIAVDDPVHIERDTPTELKIAINELPQDLKFQPMLQIKAYGPSAGLSHWLRLRDGSYGSTCDAEPRNAHTSCGHLVDVASHGTYNLWLKGATRGQYTLELALFDYRGPETLFEEPVCRREIDVDVE